jgi:hypothetical protein
VPRDIPEGWGYASEFDTREPGDMKGPSGLYQKVLRACESGEVRAYKDGKRWIVNRSDVADLKATLVAARPSVTSTVSAKKPAVSDVERLVESIDTLSFRVDLAGDAIVSVIKPLVAIHDVLSQIRDAIVDLKTPALVEPKQEIGPY